MNEMTSGQKFTHKHFSIGKSAAFLGCILIVLGFGAINAQGQGLPISVSILPMCGDQYGSLRNTAEFRVDGTIIPLPGLSTSQFRLTTLGNHRFSISVPGQPELKILTAYVLNIEDRSKRILSAGGSGSVDLQITADLYNQTIRIQIESCGTTQPPIPSTQPDEYATLQAIQGDVSVRSGSGTFKDASVGQKLRAQDDISTGPDSEVTLAFSDGSIMHIKSLTQISVVSLLRPGSRSQVRVNLKMGELAARVNKSRTVQPDYSIRTPTATTSVRGTILTVVYDQQSYKTTVGVEEGEVQVTPENPSIQSFVLSANQQADVMMNDISQIRPYTAKGVTVAGGEIRDSSGKTVGLTQRASPTNEPTVSFKSFSLEHNANWSGQKGMVIHTNFDISHALNVPCKAHVYFYYDDANDTPLQTNDPSFQTASRTMAWSSDFTPAYEVANFSDFKLFIRYSAFWLPRGTQNLKFRIQLSNKQTGQFFATSDWQRFPLVQK